MRCLPFAALFLVASWLPLAVGIQSLVRKEKSGYVIDVLGQFQLSESTTSPSKASKELIPGEETGDDEKLNVIRDGIIGAHGEFYVSKGTEDKEHHTHELSGRRTGKGAPALAPASAPGRTGKGDPHPATMNIEFGGDKRKDWVSEADNIYGGGIVTHSRPEAVKSTACDSSGCHSCTDPDSCFHGATASDKWGVLTLNVSEGNAFTNYSAEIWAHCSTANGQWWIWSSPSSISNGKLDVLVDQEGGTVALRSNWKPNEEEDGGQYLHIPAEGGGTRVRIVFYPDPKSEDLKFPKDEGPKFAKAEVWVEADHVDRSVDVCMGMKNCLNEVGDGSRASFELRNGNDEQLKCLKGKMRDMPDLLKKKCRKWRQCLNATGGKAQIVGLIGAATMEYPALIAGDKTRWTDAKGCMNPAIDDPESWDCECHETWTSWCQEPQNAAKPLKKCLNEVMCSNERICCSWKQDHCPAQSKCPASLVETASSTERYSHESSMMQRSSANSSENSDAKLKDSFDNALRDKCTG